MTFNVVCDENEQISIQSGWSHSRPGPASIVGVYADIYSGEVLIDFRMGGIGQPFEPQPPAQALTLLIGSDSHERWGHQCPQGSRGLEGRIMQSHCNPIARTTRKRTYLGCGSLDSPSDN
jgi:hypothetical protein